MKKFLMVLVLCLMAGVVAFCGAPKKEKKAEEGQPSEPVVVCTGDADCDDSNACTDDSCVAGDCAYAFKACDDSDPCTTDSCNMATGCVNVVGACCPDGAVCDDSNPCTDDSCDAATGKCSYMSNAAACDDGNVCTVNDACSDGKCQSGTAKDCDDGDLCTTDFCDGTGACVHMGECEPDIEPLPGPDTTVGPDTEPLPGPDTVAGPDTEPSPDTEEPVCVPDCEGKQCGDNGCGGSCGGCVGVDKCVVASCEDGQCKGTAKNCDDKDACTTDSCDPATGKCVFTAIDCEEGNKCTADFCDAINGCQHINNMAWCDDSDPCTTDSCDPAKGCVYTPAKCDDNNVCTDDSCDPAVEGGCVYEDASDCEDGSDLTIDFCHPSAGCQHIFFGECKTDEVCDDGDVCATDSCNPATGKCEHEPIDCDDENGCTKDSCDAATGCVNAPIDCADDDQCTDDSCDPATGECVHEFNSAPCDDGNPCTSDDKCAEDECLGGKSICECEEDVDCADFEDGNLCNGTLVCVSNKCVVDAETVVVCGGGQVSACSKPACDPATGECGTEAVNNGLICNDGSVCTSGDICWAGACAGTPINCDDGNICTTDSCDAAIGCENEFNTANCNDGSPFTSGDVCSLGVCSGVLAAVECDDNADCDDGLFCNGIEKCVAGQCKPGVAPNCNDEVACTIDACSEGNYNYVCEHVGDNSLCPLGQKCVVAYDWWYDQMGGACVECEYNSDCDDANLCTTDSCDYDTGKCVHTNNTAWCNDSNPCTTGDACTAGACVGGAAKYCNDYNDCTVDSCDPAIGCKYSAFTGGGTITCGVGACTATVNKCLAGVKQTCVAKAPGVEACGNGLDDDCDGAVDEGCSTPPPPPPVKNVCLRWSDGATNFSDVTMFGCVGVYNAGTKNVDCDGGLGEWKDQATSSGATATVTWCATVAAGKVLSGVVNYKPCLQSATLGYCSFWSPAGNGQVPVSKLDILGKFEYSVNSGATYVTLLNTTDSTAQAYLLDNGQGGANVVVKP